VDGAAAGAKRDSLPQPVRAWNRARAPIPACYHSAAMRSALLCVPGGIADRLDPAASPALHRLLSRSRRRTLACPSPESWLCQQFGLAAAPELPVGALGLLGDGGEPGAQIWLRADPVHLQADQASLVLRAAHHLDISQAEASALAAALDRHFKPDGLRFLPLRADRWYVSVPAALDVHTRSARAADGRDIDPLLPTGPDAMRLHRWVNEAQMVLHDDPVNQAREARSALPVNSVWLWGAGTLPLVERRDCTAGWGDDPVLRGLCLRAGIPVGPVRDGADWLERAGPGEHLIVPDCALDALERDWFEPLLGALRRRALDGISLVSLQDRRAGRFDLRANDLWKFWRRAAPPSSSAHA
jgi:hypothetical protein